MYPRFLALCLTAAISHHILPMDSESPLHREAHFNNPHMISQLVVYQGLSVNDPDPQTGDTPLHVAACCGNRCALKRLLAHGALPDKKNRWGNTPLHEATYLGEFECAKSLLEHGATPNRKSKNGKRPLHVAAQCGRNALIRILLLFGANPNARDNRGRTPMHLAEINNFPDTVSLLVSRGGNPAISSHYGYKVTSHPCPRSHVFFSKLEWMIERLFKAVQTQDSTEIRNLLACKTPVNVQDAQGNTPLHYAVERNDFSTMFTLLAVGADPTTKNNAGLNAVQCIFPDCDDLIRKVSFFIKATSVTPSQLWKAIRSSQRRKTEALLLYASHPLLTSSVRTDTLIKPNNPLFTCDPQGNTLLHMAALGNSPSLVQTITEYGLDPEQKNYQGRSALGFALDRLKHTPSNTAEKIYVILYQAAQLLKQQTEEEIKEKSKKTTAQEQENCCICKELLTKASRIYLSPCGHNNICRSCAATNFFPQEHWECNYHYRQVCPLCRIKVDLADLKDRLGHDSMS